MKGSNLGHRPSPAWTRHLDGVPLDELFSAGEAVEALMRHPGWGLVMRLVDAEVEATEADLDGRLLDSRAEYAHRHGRRGGLKGAREAADAIVRTAARRLEEQRAKHERDAESSQEA